MSLWNTVFQLFCHYYLWCLISLVPALALLYFYVSTFRSMCAVPNMAVFCSYFTSWFPGLCCVHGLSHFQRPVVAPQAMAYAAYTEMPNNKWRAVAATVASDQRPLSRRIRELRFLGSHCGVVERFEFLWDITLCKAANTYGRFER